jgi:RNA polymerase sigma-70 factor (TIGR02960 family)
VSTDLLERATAGDQNAFRELVEPYRSELHVHCYRILGSIQDAEDALQETLLAAWRGLKGFERRASFRTWLYSVATNRALNMLRAAKRGSQAELPMPPNVSLPEPTRRSEPVWLEPYPDVLLDAELESPSGPEARYEAKEAISLAFVTALQLLPARQRAVLILRDVLGFRAAEVAGMLDSTEESVTSALKRARATLDGRPRPQTAPPNSPAERELVDRLAAAFEANDVDAIVALLADDVRLAMPPLPLEYVGRDEAARFYGVVATRPGRRRLLQTRANGQPALAFYSQDVDGAEYVATSLTVLTLADDRFVALDRFDAGVLPHFGLPRILQT